MLIRNLVFIGLLFAGAAALSASLFPSPQPKRPERVASAAASRPAITPELDRQYHREWAEAGLKPSARASDLTILRRLSLALTGAIPSLEEIRRFESRPADGRLADWLEDIFHDRRYTSYFAERLARAFVGTEDGPFLLYRRRRFVTWLGDELMVNRPYDQVIREMIAGKGLWTDHPSSNFVTVTMDPETKVPDRDRLAARTARAFLGVRLDCAQCHDHPFQPWKQRDFQGIAAFYGKVHTGFTGLRDDGDMKYEVTDRKTGKPRVVEPRVPFLPEVLTPEGNRRQQLARWVTHPKNPHLARATVNRVWALMLGRPLVEPVDDIPSAGELPRALALLADDFVASGYNLQRLIRTIAASEVFRQDSASESDAGESEERAWSVFPLTRLRPEQVAGAIFQAASVETINQDSNILVRLGRSFGEQNFVHRYGDTGEDEFGGGCGTIPQRLLMMNGELVQGKTKGGPFNAASQIGSLAPTDRAAVEIAFLTVLTRRPSREEAEHFESRLAGTKGDVRSQHMTDLFWTLINSTEFSWCH